MPKRAERRSDRPKKRTFHGNRYFKKLKLDLAEDNTDTDVNTVTAISVDENERVSSEGLNLNPDNIDANVESTVDITDNVHASSSNTAFMKLNESVNLEENKIDADEHVLPTGYRVFDIQNLFNFINTFPCPSCFNECGYAVTESNSGLFSKLSFSCVSCKDVFMLNNSKENLNVRFQLSMYSIGCHYEQGKKFLGNMNMPPPVSTTRTNQFRKRILKATASVATDCMKQAALELKASASPSTSEVTVSCDGTWQRRGFVSKNGVSTVLSVCPQGPPKVIDTYTSSNYCDSCSKKQKKLTPEEFLIWKQEHSADCDQNHTGSSGAMEPHGILKIFQRSQEQYNLKYLGYLGDGDSKSFKTVAEAEPPIYPGKIIKKLECCGHVQKRMGRRLIDKRDECKGKMYVENGKQFKGIGGKGRLTQSAIKRIQGHYGGAIRSNSGNLSGMKKAIMAIWKHRTGVHEDCGEWCPRDLNKANQNKLPTFVTNEIKLIFEDLSADALLQKCLHGGTQNANESFHQLIWKRCPKTGFVGKQRLEIAVNDATIVYNNGELGRKAIFKNLGLEIGFYSLRSFCDSDKKRITSSIKYSQKQKNKPRVKNNIPTCSGEAGDGMYTPGGF